MKLLRTLLFAIPAAGLLPAHADPILTSWFTNNSGVLSRVIRTSPTSGGLITPVTTWPGAGVTNNNTGGAAQNATSYADVQRIRYTAADVYINSNGFASYTMGPFLSNGGGLFGFWPLSQHYQARITRSPVPAVTKTKHPGGMIGMMVNGVAIYDLGDAFSYKQSTGLDAAPNPPTNPGGDGFWSRDALAVEVVTFDPGFAHQPGSNGQYHYHAEPKALRYQLGDNMTATYSATTNTYTYTETDVSGTTTPPHHSPIIGWAFDGYPIYGPYGYDSGGATVNAGGAVTGVTISNVGLTYASTPAVSFTGGGGSGASAVAVVSGGVLTGVTMLSGGSGYSPTSPPAVTITGVRRMRTGFVKRDGMNGTTNLNSTGRTSLPRWAATAQGYSNPGNLQVVPLLTTEYGPATTYSTGTGPNQQFYTLGRYTGDYDYLGDLGKVQGVHFDLDQYNGRTCVTPEFPAGTYAYFVTIDSMGNTAFPHMLGKEYYGTSNGAAQAAVPASATELFNGGPNIGESWKGAPSVASGSGNVTITWNSVEGGTYKVEASNDLGTWSTLPNVPAAANAAQTVSVENAAAASNPHRFYKVSRTALAAYEYWANVSYTSPSVTSAGTAARGTTTGITIAFAAGPTVPTATLSSMVLQLSTGSLTGSSPNRPNAVTATANGFAIPANEPVGAKTIVVTYSNSIVVTLTGAIIVN